VQKVTSSEIVVIPYGRVYNSAAALLALALARPIITTDSLTMRELQNEVGPEWVHCLKENLSSESLLNAVKDLRRYDRRGLPTSRTGTGPPLAFNTPNSMTN
jgi:beta-1,4-mannosyltransferase